MRNSKKYVFKFGKNYAEGGEHLKSILGNKGAGLAEMSKMGIPVPSGFTISSECSRFLDQNSDLKLQIEDGIRYAESDVESKFGDSENPLLFSIRSGAAISMPGMMETILNLGLNKETVEGLSERTGDARFAYDCYRRFIEMFSHVVLQISKHKFDSIWENKKLSLSIVDNYCVPVESIKEVIAEYEELIKNQGIQFPHDVNLQLELAINAVFKSWNTTRAQKYREINGIDDDIGTAVNVQSMVFGNKGEGSATGVVFTRNPSNGEHEIFGEFLPNAQGEDIVSGANTPFPINDHSRCEFSQQIATMEELMPDTYSTLKKILEKLEQHYRDMQDVEFTIESGKCWILQTRLGKRTPAALIKIAVDMLDEGVITKKEALNRVTASAIEKILHPSIDPDVKKVLISRGLPASPGAVSGKIALSSERVESMIKNNTNVILVRNETSPEDIAGINLAVGVLTAKGGMTSHAAVVARGMGKSCITGASDLMIDNMKNSIQVDNILLKEGDWITINGTSGEIFLGEISTIQPKLDNTFKKLLTISEEVGRLKVRANAEIPKDAKVAKNFNAEGIGLCRTEHMFFDESRIQIFREMIISSDVKERNEALDKLIKFQQKDFYDLFKIMDGRSVTIRLLDPPLHEFLSDEQKDINSLSKSLNIDADTIRNRIAMMKESNPMLGHRGCRLAITYPEIYEMQVSAIVNAANECVRDGVSVIPEIMIPLVINKNELLEIKKLITNTIDKLSISNNKKIDYKIGSMIELPAAVLNIEDIAKEVDFISFGTNDLTQTTLGISRDDAGKFLKEYVNKGIIKHDPFVTIDVLTVGKLIADAIEGSRKVNPKIKIGVCGEHAGDPESIKFFSTLALDYISCSAYRVPIAKIMSGKYVF
ncbi:MAG: pyruvate,orthophosphate dikinase [Candidatus Midichloriaceae bacterium]|jgi:pyruvate,orthophosphate dikinase